MVRFCPSDKLRLPPRNRFLVDCFDPFPRLQIWQLLSEHYPLGTGKSSSLCPNPHNSIADGPRLSKVRWWSSNWKCGVKCCGPAACKRTRHPVGNGDAARGLPNPILLFSTGQVQAFFVYQSALIGVKWAHFSGRSSSAKIAVTGQTGTQAPQSMHSTGLI